MKTATVRDLFVYSQVSEASDPAVLNRLTDRFDGWLHAELAEAWDQGWYARGREGTEQERDPVHPITRTNPWSAREDPGERDFRDRVRSLRETLLSQLPDDEVTRLLRAAADQ